MAILEDVMKSGNVMTGLAIGVGAVVLAPLVIPVVRPVAKTVLKAGLAAFDQGRVMMAELNEQVEDMIAEARADLEEERKAGGNGSAAERPQTSSTNRA